MNTSKNGPIDHDVTAVLGFVDSSKNDGKSIVYSIYQSKVQTISHYILGVEMFNLS